MKKKKLSSLIFILSFAILLAACSAPKEPAESDGTVQPGLPTQAAGSSASSASPGAAPSSEASIGIMGRFQAQELNGATVDQSIFGEYSLTMVNVWATFCKPCINEMPELGEIAKEYEKKGVRIIGIVSDALNSNGSLSDEQVELAKNIVSKTKADYLHLLPSEDLFGILAQITSVPTTFFVDKDGRQVGNAYLGSKSKAKWSSIIDATLEEVK